MGIQRNVSRERFVSNTASTFRPQHELLTIQIVSSYAAHVKRHDILCQRSSLQTRNIMSSHHNSLNSTATHLVRENVLDLPKFFIQCRSSCFRWRVCLLVVHLTVPVNHPTQPKTNYLNATRPQVKYNTQLLLECHSIDTDLTYKEMGTKVFMTMM